MLAVRNVAQAQRLYDSLRKKYFLDAISPMHVPPLAKEIEWRTDPSPDAMAETNFNDDGTVKDIRLSEWLMQSYTITRGVLLHELTHMRLGIKYSCGAWSSTWKGARIPRGGPWHKEALRLISLGAMHL